MRLPQTAEYALRAVALLGLLPAGDTMRSADLARRAHVPPHYLVKVLRRLVAARLVTVRKGRGGGFALSRAPERIRLADVFAAAGATTDFRCACGVRHSRKLNGCLLEPAWTSMSTQFSVWANRTTIAHVQPVRCGAASGR